MTRGSRTPIRLERTFVWYSASVTRSGLGKKEARGNRRRISTRNRLLRDHLDRDGGVDLGVQVDEDLVRPQAPDGLLQANLLPVDAQPGRFPYLLDDDGRRDAAEEPALAARPGRDPQ